MLNEYDIGPPRPVLVLECPACDPSRCPDCNALEGAHYLDCCIGGDPDRWRD